MEDLEKFCHGNSVRHLNKCSKLPVVYNLPQVIFNVGPRFLANTQRLCNMYQNVRIDPNIPDRISDNKMSNLKSNYIFEIFFI